MSEEIKSEAPPEGQGDQPDPFKNVKEEFNRKLGNVTDELKKAVESLNSRIASFTPPAPSTPQPEKKLSDLVYEDPEQFTSRVVEKVSKSVSDSIQKTTQEQAKQNRVLADLMEEYPELGQQGGELQKQAIAEYDKIDAEDKKSPLAYKVAVRDAAARMGLKPKSARKDDDTETFSMSGSSSSGSRTQRTKEPEVDLDFAQKMGLNVSDPKVVERIKNKAKRTDWMRYPSSGKNK